MLFVSTNSETNAILGEESLQHQKLRKYFANDDNIELLVCPFDAYLTSTYEEFEALLLSKYKHYHIFIDELNGDDDKGNIFEKIIRLSQKISNDKHLWIVCYNHKDFDEKVIKQHFPVIPNLKYPLRNTAEIVNFCI